jgi:hypothetical protein
VFKPLTWIKSVGQHWGSLVTGGVIIGALGIWQGVGHTVKAWVYWSVAILGLGVANYLAWEDENDKYEAERAKHDNPNFNLALGHTLTSYNPTTNITSVCISGFLLNSGAESIASNWTARYQSPTVDVTVAAVHLYDQELEWPALGGDILVLRRNEMLPAKTLIAIPRGHSRQGRILFEIPGDRRHEVQNGVGQLWVGCCDFTGRLCQAVFKGYPVERLKTFPDETVRRQV